jgi:isocitrate dehydrogenase
MSSTKKKLVTLIPGDGIGPEVTGAARRVIEAVGAPIEWDVQAAGASVFRKGIASGVPQDTIESIRRNRVALKGPLETPVGFGEKSANVTLRKLFETYGNIRPAREIPSVPTPYSGRGIDLVVVRENIEDLYAGVEHMQTPTMAQCLKLISRQGSEKITRLAFEFARAEGRKKIHCATKANIMKLTEGMLKRVFEEIAPEYPDIESHHIIVDNCAHLLVRYPESFDVILTTNMNGDILSDLTSGFIGGLGFAPSANIGSDVAIFEAVHGTAPRYAGKNMANPTAVILSAVMMLRHLGEFDAAATIEHAVLYTLADGKRTFDVVGEQGAITTTAFTDAVISNLGKKAKTSPSRQYRPMKLPRPTTLAPEPKSRRVAGVDIFIESKLSAETLGASLDQLSAEAALRLKILSNRGTKVYPAAAALPDCTDHYIGRFVPRKEADDVTDGQIFDLLGRIAAKHRWTHIEKLHEFDGKPAFAKAQGED